MRVAKRHSTTQDIGLGRFEVRVLGKSLHFACTVS